MRTLERYYFNREVEMSSGRKLPNRKVASAFIESYLNSRAKDWGIKEDEDLVKIIERIPAEKRDTCIELLKKINDSYSYEDFLAFVFLADQKAKAEATLFAKRYGWFTTPLAKIFEKLHITEKDSFLALFIRATQTYVISELANDEIRFNQVQQTLVAAQAEKEQAIKSANSGGLSEDTKLKLKTELDVIKQKIEALAESKEYHNHFFKDKILKHDPRAAEFNELDFSDFKKNVTTGKRKLNMCDKLMTSVRQQNQASSQNTERSEPLQVVNVVVPALNVHGTFATKEQPPAEEVKPKIVHNYQLRNRR